MSKFLVIVVYCAVIGDQPTGSLDFQVRYFEDSAPENVRQILQSEKTVEDLNDQQETVRWEFCKLMAIEPYDSASMESGAELIGFIAPLEELQRFVNAE